MKKFCEMKSVKKSSKESSINMDITMYTTPYIVLTEIENRRFLYKTIGTGIVCFYCHDIIILQKFYCFPKNFIFIWFCFVNPVCI